MKNFFLVTLVLSMAHGAGAQSGSSLIEMISNTVNYLHHKKQYDDSFNARKEIERERMARNISGFLKTWKQATAAQVKIGDNSVSDELTWKPVSLQIEQGAKAIQK